MAAPPARVQSSSARGCRGEQGCSTQAAGASRRQLIPYQAQARRPAQPAHLQASAARRPRAAAPLGQRPAVRVPPGCARRWRRPPAAAGQQWCAARRLRSRRPAHAQCPAHPQLAPGQTGRQPPPPQRHSRRRRACGRGRRGWACPRRRASAVGCGADGVRQGMWGFRRQGERVAQQAMVAVMSAAMPHRPMPTLPTPHPRPSASPKTVAVPRAPAATSASAGQ